MTRPSPATASTQGGDLHQHQPISTSDGHANGDLVRDLKGLNGSASRIPPDHTAAQAPSLTPAQTLELKPNPSPSPAPPAAPPRWAHPDGRPWRVAAVIPCFNRPQDVEILLHDIARQHLTASQPTATPAPGAQARQPLIEIWITLVDNASSVPLADVVKAPPGIRLEHVRNSRNAGGAGGFNLGMAHVLAGKGLTADCGRPDFIWWIDSDARVAPTCLRELVKALARSPRLAAAGSALCDPVTRQLWELGGHVIRKNGQIVMARAGDVDRRITTGADYLAACSALVRREAIEATGLMPENFIYFDDVEWCIQCRKKTGLRVKGVPRSVAYHPPANRRFMTWGRYYIARNAFSHMNVMGMGGIRRFRRAMIEVPRAVAQTLMGQDELAELHLRGLADAVRDFHGEIEPRNLLKPLGVKPYSQLLDTVQDELAAHRGARVYVHPIIRQPMPGFEALRAQLPELFRRHSATWPSDWKSWRKRNLQTLVLRDMVAALWRALTGPTADVAIVPTGWPSCWFRGRTLIQITTDGYMTRRVTRGSVIRNGIGVYLRGLALAAKLLVKQPMTNTLPAAPAWAPQAPQTASQAPAHVNSQLPVTQGITQAVTQAAARA